MNDQNQQQQYAMIATEAGREAMIAKRAFEMESQRRKVRLMTQQAKSRIAELRDRAYEVDDRLAHASVTHEFSYPVGAFLRDTETIDHLLATLSTEIEVLANMEAAEAASRELTEKFDIQIAEVGKQGQVIEMPAPAMGGAYL